MGICNCHYFEACEPARLRTQKQPIDQLFAQAITGPVNDLHVLFGLDQKEQRLSDRKQTWLELVSTAKLKQQVLHTGPEHAAAIFC